MNIFQLVQDRFKQALTKIEGAAGAAAPMARSNRPEFGEYQFNGAMGLAKKLKSNPREIAAKILDAVELDDLAESLEIAGPGFINVKLKPQWLGEQITAALTDPRLAVEKEPEQTVVVDLSSPNLAKEMHVGHLRSTIIGDSVARVIEFLGHKVIRQNHMGDWGTQFGMLIAHLQDKLLSENVATTALSDLEDFYREAKIRFDEEEGFANRAREYVVKLQGGDQECLTLWQQFIDVSIQHSEEVYAKLNVNLKHEDIMGESAYNPMLAGIVADLKEKGIAVEDQGAQVVFLDEMKNKEGEPAVFIIEKSGGGFLYSTTDLAAMKYRSFDLNADRIIIFTDARQALHFKQAEMVGRKGGLLKAETSYEHGPFGMMLGKDGKPFKTRTGGTVKLADLLDEAVERAEKLLSERESNLSADEQKEIARKVGIGAIKYADLSKNRTTDYIFNWETMLSFEGDTAPYLQYAYTRAMSVFRKAEIDVATFNAEVIITEAQEKALAVKLLQFVEAIAGVSANSTPHLLCTYLYELSSLFMTFYEACPMLKDGVAEETKLSRMALSLLVARTLKQGLELLGIETMEKM
ncbi:arginine--tRNA ligase [Psychrosphaera sp. B3R10]|uniref:arginine--tRNA ligase n=1 Tax=unclassified Psychrosphaera TaxID=2641570 RepID=UPI001C082BAF|nr:MULTISPECIES: arginine--tRNA ligase [unclassified Psychrosphaera]MBU2881225.1 arginine--tRNA ligase [Psychrosphaera sp. I2R16]MBU2990068.1 arginine--tRNA ligase [Psychrosphaera sp. B3R10]